MATIDELASELLSVVMSDDPIGASLLGIPGHDGLLPDFAEEAQRASVRKLAEIASRADEAPNDEVGETERQTLDFVRHTASVMRDAGEVPLIEWTIAAFHAAPVASALALLPKVPLDTDERAEGYLTRLRKLPEMLEVAKRRHLNGIASGRTPVARLVRQAIDQIDTIVTDASFGGMKRDRGSQDAAFDNEVARLVDEVARPALTRYRDALSDEVLGASRDDDRAGISWLPRGNEMYAALCRLHTSTLRNPEDLHATGRAIIDQVEAEFAEVGSRLWGTSDAALTLARLREDPALRYSDAAQMMELARRAVRRAEAAAPLWFGVVPEDPCAVEPLPEFEEPGTPAAYYLPGALDGARKGTFYVNTSRPKERYLFLAEPVAFHEAVPGHHLQLTIAQDGKDLPMARRILFDTACAEGWGLYAERLADEMGLYSDDVARLGMLVTDAWRASRLVVDTGLHHLGWSREQAIEWMTEHTALPALEIAIEVDRYISYPAQALAYMVGRIELDALRARAVSRLGDRFDVRAFHDHVLRIGPLPLSVLGDSVDRWIALQTA